jgi:hypothetical protein
MANTLETLQILSRDAGIYLSDDLVMGALINRDHQQKFTTSSGGDVDVAVVANDTATEVDLDAVAAAAVTASDITETKVRVPAKNFISVVKEVNTEEALYEVNSISEQVVRPAMKGLAESIDARLMANICGGFAQNVAGTAGTSPAVAADITLARKTLRDNRCDMSDLVGVIGSTAEQNFLGLDNFINQDYGQPNAVAIREASLGRKYGIDWYVSNQAGGSLSTGDTAGTVLANGAAQTGTTLVIDGLTATTGKVKAGTIFSVAGVTGTYTTTQDAVIAANATTLVFTPALDSSPADDAALTIETQVTQDFIYNPRAAAGAIIAPAPLSVNSAVELVNGLSVRVSMDSEINPSSGTPKSVMRFDVFVGAKVIQPSYGVIIQS